MSWEILQREDLKIIPFMTKNNWKVMFNPCDIVRGTITPDSPPHHEVFFIKQNEKSTYQYTIYYTPKVVQNKLTIEWRVQKFDLCFGKYLKKPKVFSSIEEIFLSFKQDF